MPRIRVCIFLRAYVARLFTGRPMGLGGLLGFDCILGAQEFVAKTSHGGRLRVCFSRVYADCEFRVRFCGRAYGCKRPFRIRLGFGARMFGQ